MINVVVLFFASLRDELNVGECKLQLADGSLETLRAELVKRLGDSAELLWAENVRVAKNQTVLSLAELRADFSLVDGDELAFLPPVTGG